MSKFFQHSAENPFHISVGAVVVNDEGSVLVHTYKKEGTPERWLHHLGGLDAAHILMRESLEEGETLEEAVARGLKEEFGVTGEIRKYLGSIQVQVNAEHRTFEKTTLYFEVGLLIQGERPASDEESFSTLEWIVPETLIKAMQEQGREATRPDLDESKILKTYVTYR